MKNQTIIATYANLDVAKKVINDLIDKGHPRENIGLAIHTSLDEALLALTTTEDKLEQAIQIVERAQPLQTDIRTTGWRNGGDIRDLYPDEEAFTAVEMKNDE